jgi:hypothetical protein
LVLPCKRISFKYKLLVVKMVETMATLKM